MRAQPKPRTSKKTNQDAEKTQERRPTRHSERTSDVKRTRFESSRRQGTTPRQASRSSSSAGKAKAKGTLIPLPKPKTIKEGGTRGDYKARGKNATATRKRGKRGNGPARRNRRAARQKKREATLNEGSMTDRLEQLVQVVSKQAILSYSNPDC